MQEYKKMVEYNIVQYDRKNRIEWNEYHPA